MDYCIHWFRRDLRLNDNHALYHAIQSGYPVKCIFIFDTIILSQLPEEDKRVSFIYQQIQTIKSELQKIGSDLYVYYGSPVELWKSLAEDRELKEVFTNRDYEPYAQQRDKSVFEILKEKNIPFKGYKDHVIFDKDEVLTGQGNPYTVYTPYMKKWKANLQPDVHLKDFNITLDAKNFYPEQQSSSISLNDLGFKEFSINLPLDLTDIAVFNYDKVRNNPSLDATSYLGTALRFGTVSIRRTVAFAMEQNQVYLNELIWRDFFSQILYHHPHVVHEPYREKYKEINWRNNEDEFELWCQGKTGFPIVDAGMRQLNTTGFMHNRIRMVTASFLIKDLLIDWRWGEAYFAQKLMDYDLASNNGNWQWAAGTGTDAAPYFRIFNPTSQQKKFDPDYEYVRRWVPEFGTEAYTEPIVDHKFARERCLTAYKASINKYE